MNYNLASESSEPQPVVHSPAPVVDGPAPGSPREPVVDAIALDDATREELGKFTPDEVTQLEALARDASPEDFRRLVVRASLSPGSFPEASLLERVPALQSRDQVLEAVQQVRPHEADTDTDGTEGTDTAATGHESAPEHVDAAPDNATTAGYDDDGVLAQELNKAFLEELPYAFQAPQ